jgi:hypothetical protein
VDFTISQIYKKNLNRFSEKKENAGRIWSGQAAPRWACPDPAKGAWDGGGCEPASGSG